MKRSFFTGAVRLMAVAAVGGGLLGGLGCSKSEGPGSEASTGAGPTGEPIRGESIQAPVSGGATQAVASIPEGTGTGVGTSVVATGSSTTLAVAASEAAAVGGASTGTADSPLTVGFDRLAAFQYTLPEGPVDTNTVVKVEASAQIPVTIQALNNQFISLKGFMLPLKVEKGLVTELLIMRDQSMCCYGTVPKINEWVSVKMVGSGVKPVMDQAVTLFGRLKVGEMYENGYLVGIYAMDGERMAGPLDM
jgi:hypothetical protein